MLYSRSNKKAAIELSITTVIIIVIGVSLLILGMFLVRNIMCGAISLTSTSISGAKSEIERLFGSSGSEVTCIGASGDPVKMVPGKTNIIYCAFRSPSASPYNIHVTSMTLSNGGTVVAGVNPSTWKVGAIDFSGSVAPSDNDPKKVLVLTIPQDTPDSTLSVSVDVCKSITSCTSGTNFYRHFDLTFDVSRQGFIQNAVC